MAKQTPPLGGSAKISIGGKAYSSTPPQGIQTSVQTGSDPRNIANRNIDNLAHTVRTATTPDQAAPAKVGGSGGGQGAKPPTAASSGSGGVVRTATPIKPSTAASGGSSGVSKTVDKSKPLSYSAQQAAQPLTAVKTKEVTSGYKLATSVKAGVLISQAKTAQPPVYATPTPEQSQKAQGSIQRGTSISVTPQTIISQKPVVRGYQKPILPQSNVIVKAKTQAQNALNTQNDSGSSSVSTTISAAGVTVKTVQLAQAASPYAIKTAQGVYNVGEKTVRVVKSVDSTLGMIQMGIIPLNKQTMVQFRDFAADKFVHTKPVQNLIHAVNGVQTRFNNTVAGVKTAVNTTVKYGLMLRNGTMKAVSLVHGVAYGTIQIQISKEALKNVRNLTWKGAKWTGKFIGNGVKTGVVFGAKAGWQGVKFGWKGSKKFGTGIGGVGNALLGTQDTGVQAAGMGLKVAEYGIKGIHTAPKVVRGVHTGIKGTVKTARGAMKIADSMWFKFKYLGFKNTMGYYKTKALNAVAKAGGSAVQAAVELLKQLGAKIVVPALLLIAGLVLVFNLISAPVSGVGAIFGGTFTNKDTGIDFDIHEYLMVNIEPYKTAFVNKLLAIQTKAFDEDGYHYVRLFAQTNASNIDDENSVNERHTPITADDISGSLSDSMNIVAIIEPLFQTIMLTKYDLEPTELQISDTIQELWDNLFRVETTDLPIEYCGDATTTHTCGSYHANITTCPNINSGTHDSYGCSTCCYTYDCGGEFCSGNHHACNGYNYCDGHKILAITFNMDGVYELMAKYFTDPINRLANIPNRTPEQQDELDTLKDNYELCLAYLEEVQANFGLGGGVTDLSGVDFVNGTRAGSERIIELAKSQVGQVGGQPYWSWYGFRGRVEWCACFVSWCLNQTGYSSPKFASCNGQGVPWFKERGQWAAGGFSDLAAGDVIFFDWNGDGRAQHVGLVIGTDGEYVYTVEGNSGDAVRLKSYRLTSSVILGYGIPNY